MIYANVLLQHYSPALYSRPGKALLFVFVFVFVLFSNYIDAVQTVRFGIFPKYFSPFAYSFFPYWSYISYLCFSWQYVKENTIITLKFMTSTKPFLILYFLFNIWRMGYLLNVYGVLRVNFNFPHSIASPLSIGLMAYSYLCPF